MENIKIEIIDLHLSKLYQGLMLGKPKPHQILEEVEKIKTHIRRDLPRLNLSNGEKWTVNENTAMGLKTGTWGSLAIAHLKISEEDNFYEFLIIFNIIPEKENLIDVIKASIENTDWKKYALKWNIGDM